MTGATVGPEVAVTTTVWMTGGRFPSEVELTVDSAEHPRIINANNIGKQNIVVRRIGPLIPPSVKYDEP